MPIYLDYNATTPVAPEVCRAISESLQHHFGNPSSSHSLGQAAKESIDRSRAQVAAMIGADDGEILFTSGGSESNNMAIKGLLHRNSGEPGHLIISAIEHPATVEPANYLQRWGIEVTVVGCDTSGVIDVEEIENAIQPNTRLVSIMHANNEIGTIQPIAEISTICRQQGVLLHTDAAQSIGKVRVDVNELGVDLLSIAGHKLYAPKGVGALYIRSGVELENLVHGAGHEQGRRAGTENTPYWVGLGKAAELITNSIDQRLAHLSQMRDILLSRLNELIDSPLTVNGADVNRLPNTLSVNFPNVIGSELLAASPGVCASTGAACHSGETKLSATLAAIGLHPDIAKGTVRLSVGTPTTPDEIEQAATLLAKAWTSLQ